MFESEEILTSVFDTALAGMDTPFVPKYTAAEFDYREGRTDIIACDESGNLLAFEMKLVKWKQALHQAYRNSSFAHYSYIVVPSYTAQRAIKYEYEFLRRGIGLCSIDTTAVKILISARWIEPLRPWLTETAKAYLLRGGTCLLNQNLLK